MQAVAIPQITERLQRLPPDKLAVVYDFVSYLLEREAERLEGQSWDEQLGADVKAGKLDRVAKEAVADFEAGRCTEL